MRLFRTRVCAISIAVAFSMAGHVSAFAYQVMGGMGDGSEIPHAGKSNSNRDTAKIAQKKLVDFNRGLSPGSLYISTSERALYYVVPDGKAWRYPVGVGREGFAWSGDDVITRKAEWPEWRPPTDMIAREAKRGNFLPKIMAGGPRNPLGARALYIGDTEYRIHGTTQPWSIGRAVSSGCIRMLNDHVIELFAVVQPGARVVVAR
jgi:lipoprotein-anchoring transpeptidase ErfK/SrfK